MPKKYSARKGCPVSICFKQNGNTCILRCGQWNCPHCARMLSKKWAKRAYLQITQAGDNLTLDPNSPDGSYWFMTFTLQGRRLSIARAYELLPTLWERLRKRQQYHNANWCYLAFVEGQPNRAHMPHFHVLSSSPPAAKRNKAGIVTKHAMHDFAHSMGFGFQADHQIVTSLKAAFYVTKYMSKQSAKTPHGFRRVRHSEDWAKLPPAEHDKYIVMARGEGLGSYLARVSDETGLTEADAYMRFLEAWSKHADALPQFPRKY